jgi:N-acetylneuraminic acid mutarotase
MLKKIFLILAIVAGLVWFYYWYVRGINLLLDEPVDYPPPYSWATRIPADKGADVSISAWTQAAPMPTARTGAAAAALGDEIYVIGGLDGFGRTVATVEVFDTKANSWRTAAPLSIAIHHAAAAAVAGRVFVMGGEEGLSSSPVNSVFSYDPGRNEWRSLADLPKERGGASAVVVDGKVHLLGGSNRLEILDSHLVFDPAIGQWTSGEPMPSGRDRLVAVIHDRLLWAVGGRGGSTLYNLNDAVAMDLESGRWADPVAMTTPRSAFAAAADGRVYVFGGETATSVISSIETFDPSSMAWETLAPMPHPRYGAAFAQVGERVFIIGGSARVGFSVSDLNEVYELPPRQP